MSAKMILNEPLPDDLLRKIEGDASARDITLMCEKNPQSGKYLLDRGMRWL